MTTYLAVTYYNYDKELSGYRFHDDDIKLFGKYSRFTIRCGEYRDGKILHNPTPTKYSIYVLAFVW